MSSHFVSSYGMTYDDYVKDEDNDDDDDGGGDGDEDDVDVEDGEEEEGDADVEVEEEDDDDDNNLYLFTIDGVSSIYILPSDLPLIITGLSLKYYNNI